MSYGPREVDLIPSWHAQNRYGRGGTVAAFASAYGYNLPDSPMFPALMAMRDMVQLAGPLRRASESPELARVLHERLNSIHADDGAIWTAY